MINPDLILNVEQSSPEWFAARVGMISASNFSKIITSTGKKSTSATTYMNSLIAETLMGRKINTHQADAMTRGIEMEAEARQYYELVTGFEASEVGLVYKDENKRVSCSPDGLIGDFGLEIKSPLPSTQIKYLLSGKLPSEYKSQVQGSMYVTGLSKWDFLSYRPEINHLLVTVEYDEVFTSKLDEYLTEFIGEMDEKLNKIKGGL